jgi:hypothetical protein
LSPACGFLPEQQPTAVVKRFGGLERFQAAGKDVPPDADQAGGTVAPHRSGPVVGRFITIYTRFGFNDWLQRAGSQWFLGGNMLTKESKAGQRQSPSQQSRWIAHQPRGYAKSLTSSSAADGMIQI